MPNIKASILSVKRDEKRHAKNAAEKSRVRTASRRVLEAVEGGDKTKAEETLRLAVKTIDQAAANHVYHKNAAARRKSRLAKKVNAMT